MTSRGHVVELIAAWMGGFSQQVEGGGLGAAGTRHNDNENDDECLHD